MKDFVLEISEMCAYRRLKLQHIRMFQSSTSNEVFKSLDHLPWLTIELFAWVLLNLW
jgi:hypothetical protein